MKHPTEEEIEKAANDRYSKHYYRGEANRKGIDTDEGKAFARGMRVARDYYEEWARDQQPKWIDVKTGPLPEMGQRFDAWMDGDYREANCGAYVGYWDKENQRETMLLKGIRFWQPLPEGPNQIKP